MSDILASGKLEAFEPAPPNPDVVRLTELILAQHDKILNMNARLLQTITAPMQIVAWAESEGEASKT